MAVFLALQVLGCHDEHTPGQPPQDAATASTVAAPWPEDLHTQAALLRLRAHYHEAGRAAAVVESGASSSTVRTEAAWLVRVYEHVAAHFDIALRDGFGDAAADAPDPALHEFTDWSTRAPLVRERGFAAEATRNHAHLVTFVHSPAFSRMALHDELLREIRFDVESSQAAQIGSFGAAVASSTP